MRQIGGRSPQNLVLLLEQSDALLRFTQLGRVGLGHTGFHAAVKYRKQADYDEPNGNDDTNPHLSLRIGNHLDKVRCTVARAPIE